MKHATLAALVLEHGLFPTPLRIETVIRPGIPVFRIGGLRRTSRDREDRIKTALLASGIAFPYTTVLINASPSEIGKDSSLLDLPIAVCLLQALGEIPPWDGTLFLGELSLTGELLTPADTLALTLSAAPAGFQRIVLPATAARSVPPCGIPVHGVADLKQLIGGRPAAREERSLPRPPATPVKDQPPLSWHASRAIALAAAGRHPLLLVGPPGTGKSTAARFMHSLLPAPDEREWLEMVRLALLFQTECTGRPLRNPHHSLTVAGMVGGGNPLRAGEISRSTHGLLLLDELSQYDGTVVQALREPMEKGIVVHNRGGRPGILPASFWFAATSNPCPCGFFGSRQRKCCCSRAALDRSRSILAGPLRDRVDIELFVDSPSPLDGDGMLQPVLSQVLDGIKRAVGMQERRYGRRRYNGELNGEETERYCDFENARARELWLGSQGMTGSRRQEGGVRRLARTIADMDEAPCIRAKDVVEALTFRFQHAFWDSPPPTRGRGNPDVHPALSHQKV